MEALVIEKFDYDQLDTETSAFLRQKEEVIKSIASKAIFEMGKELKEAHDKLANHANGTFERWVSNLNMSDQTARNCISVYEFNCKHSLKAGNLSISLMYEIAKKTAPIDLVQSVLDGDITTRKEYMDLLSKKKAAEKLAKSLGESVSVLNSELREIKQNNGFLTKDNRRLQEVNEEINLKVVHSNTRYVSEFNVLIADISSYVNSLIPKAKLFTKGMNDDERIEACNGAISEMEDIIRKFEELRRKVYEWNIRASVV